MNTPRSTASFLVSFLLAMAAVAPAPARAQAATTPELSVAEKRSQLLGAVAAHLSAHFRAEGELQLESVRPIVFPASGSPSSVEILEFPAALAASMIVRVRAGAPDTPEQTLVLRAQLFREVWVTRTPSERDGSFDPAQLDARRVDVLRERETIPVTELCRDYTFNRAVPAGRVLTWRDLSRRTLVRRGQVIEVAAIAGSLSITMKALAMENGAEGEMVKVRNLDSKKEFNALVTADSRAQVNF